MDVLTSRQRVLAALNRQQPDRVPFLETVIDESVALPLLGRTMPSDAAPVEMNAGPEDPLVRGCLLGSPRYEPMELVEALGLDGFGMYIFLPTEREERLVDGHMRVAGGRLRTRADLNRLRLPDPDDPAIYLPYQRFIEQHRPTGKALYCFTNLCSDPVILGMGFEQFSLSLYDDPGLVEDVFALYSEWTARAVHHLTQLDFDFFWFGDDIAFRTAPYVSPRIFRKLFIPHYRRVIERVTKPWIFHSDGNLLPILDDLVGLGLSGLHPIEPAAMDIGDLKKRYGDRLCLVGGIDLDLLSRGTPEEVDQLVHGIIQKAAPGGGYIAGSSNSIPYYCQAVNVRAMEQAIHRYGRYPL